MQISENLALRTEYSASSISQYFHFHELFFRHLSKNVKIRICSSYCLKIRIEGVIRNAFAIHTLFLFLPIWTKQLTFQFLCNTVSGNDASLLESTGIFSFHISLTAKVLTLREQHLTMLHWSPSTPDTPNSCQMWAETVQ